MDLVTRVALDRLLLVARVDPVVVLLVDLVGRRVVLAVHVVRVDRVDLVVRLQQVLVNHVGHHVVHVDPRVVHVEAVDHVVLVLGPVGHVCQRYSDRTNISFY